MSFIWPRSADRPTIFQQVSRCNVTLDLMKNICTTRWGYWKQMTTSERNKTAERAGSLKELPALIVWKKCIWISPKNYIIETYMSRRLLNLMLKKKCFLIVFFVDIVGNYVKIPAC